MKLRAIELESFRSYRRRVRIEGLGDGLNVIAGDNEEGKSTLLRGIKAALFDRYRSTAGDGFRPYGQDVSPRVRLEFEFGGDDYELEKVFSKRRDGRATLQRGTDRWDNEAAEEKLADLLGFSHAPRGEARLEHQGLLGVLWIEQGGSHEPVTLPDQARGSFEAVFGHEVDALLGGDRGSAVLRRVLDLRGELLTTTGRPRADYAAAVGRVEELEQALAEGRRELEAWEGDCRRLAAIQEELAELVRDDAIATARAAERRARTGVEQVEALERARDEAGKVARVARLEADGAQARWSTRRALAECIEELAAQRQALAVEETDYKGALARADERLRETSRLLGEAREQRLALERVARALGARARSKELAARIEELEQTLADVRSAEGERRDAARARDAIPVDAERMAEARKLHDRLRLASARLEARASRLAWSLEPDASASLDGDPLDQAGERSVVSGALLEIPGTGRFELSAGAAGREAERDEVDRLGAEFAALLSGARSDTFEDLEDRHRLRERHAGVVEAREALLLRLAPRGIAELEARLARLCTDREGLASVEPPDGPDGAELDEDGARAELDALERRIGELEASERTARAARERAFETVAGAHARSNALARERQARENELASAREEVGDLDLRTAAEGAAAAAHAAEEELASTGARLEAADPGLARLELQRCQEVREGLERREQQLAGKARDLEIELLALGQRGLAEIVVEQEARLGDARREAERLTRRARALELLASTLTDRLSAAREALVTPISERIQPYLRQLLPDARPLLDETFVLTGIRRAESEEPFAALSIGTREQLAVLVRLAFADLLAERGLPVSVLLDDALVHSDDERRDRMKRILYQAGQRYQVLLLTCHAREYRDAGGTFLRLDEAAAAG